MSVGAAREVSSPQNETRKDGALQTEFAAASGSIVVIQDADLECDPQEIIHLVAPIKDVTAGVCVRAL